MYEEDELLLISGIQHFYFCKRQWALIHVEQQWEENLHTIKGQILHEKVDDPLILESRGDYLVSRSMPLVSKLIGFYGISDAVEFRQDTKGCSIRHKDGLYKVVPVEYKVGKPKEDFRDAVQLCVQAICLEEMFDTRIEEGFLFYGKTRRREKIIFDENLRKEVTLLSQEMHLIFANDIKLAPIYSEKCDRCSLYSICLPKATEKFNSVSKYLYKKIKEVGEDN